MEINNMDFLFDELEIWKESRDFPYGLTILVIVVFIGLILNTICSVLAMQNSRELGPGMNKYNQEII